MPFHSDKYHIIPRNHHWRKPRILLPKHPSTWIIMVSFGPSSRVDLVVNGLLYPLTLQKTNISHHGKRKISFKRALGRGYISSLEGNHLLTEVILLPPMLFPQLEPRPNRTDSAPELRDFFSESNLETSSILWTQKMFISHWNQQTCSLFWYGGKDVNIKTNGLLIDLKWFNCLFKGHF